MNMFFAAFCVLPPTLLGAKMCLKWRISSWWLFASFVLVGWILVNLAIWRHFEDMTRLAWYTPGASDKLKEAAQTDGAARVFGLFFGWTYAAVYFGAWALAFSVGAFVHGRLRKSFGPPA